jgi:protein CMS1
LLANLFDTPEVSELSQPSQSVYRPTTSTIAMPIADDLQEPLLERLSASPEPDTKSPITTSKKRKRGVVSADEAAKKSKSQKNGVDEDELDFDIGINKAFSHMDNQLLADYIAQRTRKYESDLSSIELEDKHIPGILCLIGM